MRKINKLNACVILCVATFTAHAQQVAPVIAPASAASSSNTNLSASKDSTRTVDALLKIENSKALDRAKKEAQTLFGGPMPTPIFSGAGMMGLPGASSPMPIIPVIKPPVITPTLYVESIYGVGQTLYTTVSYSGQRQENLGVGSRVGPCEIKSIMGRQVVLEPVALPAAPAASTVKPETKKHLKKSSRKVSAAAAATAAKTRISNCPSGTWTGSPNPALMMNVTMGMPTGVSSSPMPMPMPTGPIPFPQSSTTTR